MEKVKVFFFHLRISYETNKKEILRKKDQKGKKKSDNEFSQMFVQEIKTKAPYELKDVSEMSHSFKCVMIRLY